MKSIPENIAQLAQQIFKTYCVKSEAARLLVFNLKAKCDTWIEGFRRVEGEINEKKKEENAWRPKVEEFLRTAEELVERTDNSMCNTHIIVAANGEVTGERLTNQFEGYTRVAEKGEKKEQGMDENWIDNTEVVVSNFGSKCLHDPWSVMVKGVKKICKVYRSV
jgi:hypothetical protein